jgi:hypothetical protein
MPDGPLFQGPFIRAAVFRESGCADCRNAREPGLDHL